MKTKYIFNICFVALFGLNPINVNAQEQCAVELVLALDVSGSVDWKEYRLQRVGIASAFRDSEVTELISHLPGGIQVAITQWSGPHDQRTVLNWHSIQNEKSSLTFADKIEETSRYASGAMTAIGNALDHASKLLKVNPKICFKSIIDVSADGYNNNGNEPNDVAAVLESKGVTLNNYRLSSVGSRFECNSRY